LLQSETCCTPGSLFNSFFTAINAETKKMKRIFIGIYGSIFIIGLAYMSGEQVGEAIYFLSPKKLID